MIPILLARTVRAQRPGRFITRNIGKTGKGSEFGATRTWRILSQAGRIGRAARVVLIAAIEGTDLACGNPYLAILARSTFRNDGNCFFLTNALVFVIPNSSPTGTKPEPRSLALLSPETFSQNACSPDSSRIQLPRLRLSESLLVTTDAIGIGSIGGWSPRVKEPRRNKFPTPPRVAKTVAFAAARKASVCFQSNGLKTKTIESP